MRVVFSSLDPPRFLPRNPLLRALAIAVGVLVLAGLLFFGLVAGLALLAIGAIALLLRRLFPRRRPARREDAGIIDGEFSVVEPHPRAALPRADHP